MANQPIFGYGKHLEFRPPIRDRPKTGFSEAARERNKVFAYRRNRPHGFRAISAWREDVLRVGIDA